MLINEFQDKEEIIDLINKNEYFANLTQNMEVMEKNKLAISLQIRLYTSKNASSKKVELQFLLNGTMLQVNKLIEEALELSLINVKLNLVD